MGQAIMIGYDPHHDDDVRVAIPASIAKNDGVACLTREGRTTLLPETKDWFVYLEPMDQRSVAEDVATNPDAPADLRRTAHNLAYVHVRFSNFEIARRLAQAVAAHLCSSHVAGWIDTDYGEHIPVCEFIRRLASDPSYDWRQP